MSNKAFNGFLSVLATAVLLSSVAFAQGQPKTGAKPAEKPKASQTMAGNEKKEVEKGEKGEKK
ncbi:MAG TPA: hypothetical protein DER07_10170, partial [Armatimonadetes bacterium]|nr:hypothetical protein [Armatimonadota bacterium]